MFYEDVLLRKNNLAAKKSRDTRRMRENQLRLRVLFLENANKVIILYPVTQIILYPEHEPSLQEGDKI